MNSEGQPPPLTIAQDLPVISAGRLRTEEVRTGQDATNRTAVGPLPVVGLDRTGRDGTLGTPLTAVPIVRVRRWRAALLGVRAAVSPAAAQLRHALTALQGAALLDLLTLIQLDHLAQYSSCQHQN